MEDATNALAKEGGTAFHQMNSIPFTETEKVEITILFKKIFFEIQKKKRIPYDRDFNLNRFIEYAKNFSQFSTFANKQFLDQIFEEECRAAGWREKKIIGYKQNLLLPIHEASIGVGNAYLLQREFRVLGFQAPLSTIYRYLREASPEQPVIYSKGYHEKMEELAWMVERRLIEDNQINRKNRITENAAAKALLQKLKFRMARFSMPKGERKRIYRETREQIRQGSIGTLNWGTLRGFKQARLGMGKRLQELGYNPDFVFSEIGVVGENETALTRLKVLTTILRRAQNPKQAKEIIDAVRKKYSGKSTGASLGSQIQSIRYLQFVNPKKEAERMVRATRQDTPNGEPKIKKPATKPLPTSLNGYLALFKEEKRITDEQAVGLNKLLQSIRPKDHSKEAVDKAVEYQVLLVVASRFQKSGRVSQTALRELCVPPILYESFSRALVNLRKKNILEYEAHGGKNDNISLVEKTANQTLGKYNTKIARQHENGK